MSDQLSSGPMVPDPQRQALAAHLRALTGRMSLRSAAAEMGISPATASRLLNKPESLALKFANCGRRTDHALTPNEQAAAKLFALEKNSRRLAAEELIRHPDCTAETANRLQTILGKAAMKGRAPVWPAWWNRACTLTDEDRALFGGPKHIQAVEPIRSRGCFYDIDGQRFPLFPNALWESDDESENVPTLSDDGKAHRQTLKTIDVFSEKWLGVTSIARDSDAYTLEDQSEHVRALVEMFGWPVAWRIERGPWENGFWWGIKLPRDFWFTPDCPKYRFGGIHHGSGGPVNVLRAFKSRHKATVEGAFNHRQNLHAHLGLDIGRHRGQFEAAARIMRRVHAGQADAMAELQAMAAGCDVSSAVLARFNQEAKARRMFGGSRHVPDELFATGLPGHEPQHRPLTTENAWRLWPCKFATVHTNGRVQTRLERYQTLFAFETAGQPVAAGPWPYLPHGWPVFVAFHPMRLDWGAKIFNARHPDDPANPARIPRGAWLMDAPFQTDAPAFRVRSAGADFSGPRTFAKTMQQETRVLKDAGKAAARRSIKNDGAGRVTMADSQADHAAHTSQIDAESLSRSAADHRAGSGSGRGRAATGHEPRRISGGETLTRRQTIAAPDLDELAALEAAFK